MAGPVEIVARRPDRVAWAPTDALRLIVAAVALIVTLVVAVLFEGEVVNFLTKLLRGLDALPEWLVTLVVDVSQLLALVLFGGGLAVALWRREWRFLVSIVLAMIAAALLFAAVRPLLDHVARAVTDANDDYTAVDPDRLPSSVAVVTALVTAAAPWVSRRWRRLAWLVVVLTAFVWFVTSPIALDVIVALLCGWTAGALIVVVFGAPSRRPSGEAIATGLSAVGVPLARLEQADVDARGSSPYFAVTADGSPLFVKALGEDERSADLMFRAYRRVMPRDLGDEKAFSSLRRAVEHEALVALAVATIGVRTPRLVAFSTADPNGFVLAYEQIAGKSFDRVPADRFTDDALRGVWEQLAVLRAHRVAHRDLRLANVFLDDADQAWIIDFGFSELAASDLLLDTDVAELLASSATMVGVERSVAVASSVVGNDVLTLAHRRLHLSMLSGATRTAMKAAPGLLDSLRQRVDAPAVSAV